MFHERFEQRTRGPPKLRRQIHAFQQRRFGRQKHYVVIDFAFATRFRLPRHVHPNVPETALRLANVQGNAQAPARTFRPDQLGTALDVEAALELGLQLPDDRTEHAGEFLTHLLRKVSGLPLAHRQAVNTGGK